MATLVLCACGSATPSSEKGPAHTFTVAMQSMKFGPVPTGLKAGDTIRWVNDDIFQHSATAADNSFDLDLAPGASGTTVIGRAGTVPFFCKYHPGMKGRLVVGS